MNTPSRPTVRLALEDGAVFRGAGFGDVGAGRTVWAEVVFNTAMTGYQEALTDPSYAGQILAMTAPLIGNYGVNDEDVESDQVHVSGFIVRELARRVSNHRATSDLDAYLRRAGVLGLSGVDTRALTRRLRAEGALRGVMSDEESLTDDDLVERARTAPPMDGRNLAAEVGCRVEMRWSDVSDEWITVASAISSPPAERPGPLRVLALDCGAKRNIFRHLAARGCEVRIAPHDTPVAALRAAFEAGEADGLFISNGPGDPAAVERTIQTLRELLADAATSPPTFGICLGHQLLALALGGRTFKLKFGHHGVNQPVYSAYTGHVEITSQNHGFCVNAEALPAAGLIPTHVNLNDGTLAGFAMRDRPVLAVQHHPEASPGPHDAGYLFDEFVRMMVERSPAAPAGAERAAALLTPARG